MRSTLDLQNDFAKNKTFKGTSTAQIINLGSLNASQGSIALIASDINQLGSLNAQNGTVALIGSNYHSEWDCQFGQTGSRITHSGRIDAPGGHVHLMAGEIFVFGTSEITTSSAFNGGEILIGAGQQGKDPAFTNAQMIWVDEGARFFADSWEQGNGGRVILFSDQMTDFSGHISAQGRKLGGDGGFAEVSGGYLAYKGLADLKSPNGGAGTLLLDPSDITITLGAAVTPTVAPAVFPLGCTTASVAGFITQNLPIIPSTIGIGTLGAQLLLGHVIIDSTGGLGLTGNITWAAGADFPPLSANDLVLRAPAGATVTMNSRVQNGGTGRVIIDSAGPTVNISTLANIQGVSFGSQNGLTQICAPNAIVNVAGPVLAQVGYYTVLGDPPSTGPISIICRELNISGSSQVGHGQIDAAIVGNSTLASATIDIVTTGDILINPGKIGNGSFINLTLADLAGDITITCGGNLTGMAAQIGNGPFAVGGGVLGAFEGNIDVCVPNGSISFLTGSAFTGGIGHGGDSMVFTNLSGNIDVCAGVDITLTVPNGFARVGISHVGGTAGGYVGHTFVTAGRDIRTIAGPGCNSGDLRIGITTGGVITHSTQIVCGRDFFANIGETEWLIGSTAAGDVRTFVAAGRDVDLTVGQCSGFGIEAAGNVAIAAGRNFSGRPLDIKPGSEVHYYPLYLAGQL